MFDWHTLTAVWNNDPALEHQTVKWLFGVSVLNILWIWTCFILNHGHVYLTPFREYIHIKILVLIKVLSVAITILQLFIILRTYTLLFVVCPCRKRTESNATNHRVLTVAWFETTGTTEVVRQNHVLRATEARLRGANQGILLCIHAWTLFWNYAMLLRIHSPVVWHFSSYRPKKVLFLGFFLTCIPWLWLTQFIEDAWRFICGRVLEAFLFYSSENRCKATSVRNWRPGQLYIWQRLQ